MRKLHKRGCPGNGLFWRGSIPPGKRSSSPGRTPRATRNSAEDIALGLPGKPDRLFIDCQNNASCLADYAMPSSGSVDRQRSRLGRPVLVALRTGQDDNMLVASVLMEGHLSFGSIPEQSGGRPRDSISVEAMDLHTVAKGLPRNGVGVLGNSKEIVQFYARIARSRIRFHSARKSNPRVPEMARLLSQIAAVSKEGVGWKM